MIILLHSTTDARMAAVTTSSCKEERRAVVGGWSVTPGQLSPYNLTSTALTEPERNITFTASHEIGEGNSVTATIDPREPNAEPPVFSSSAYAANIDENAGEGTTINIAESIFATDPEGRPVAYSLSPSSELLPLILARVQ